MIEIPVQTTDPAVLERMQQTVKAAMQGDESVVPELRRLLAAHPEIVDTYGDLAGQVERSWLSLVAGPDLVLRESVGIKLEALRRELGPAPTALERLAVGRLLSAWLAVEHADGLVAQCRDASPAHHAALQRRLSWSQTRFFQATRALATLRRLLTPPVSPLQLLGRDVAETTGGTSRRRRATLAEGLPVEN